MENLDENEKFMDDLILEPGEVKIEKKSESSVKRKRSHIKCNCCTVPESPTSKPKEKISEKTERISKQTEKISEQAEKSSEKPKKKYKKRLEMPETENEFNYQTPSHKYKRKLMFEDKSLPPGWFRRLYYRSSGQRSVFQSLEI